MAGRKGPECDSISRPPNHSLEVANLTAHLSSAPETALDTTPNEQLRRSARKRKRVMTTGYESLEEDAAADSNIKRKRSDSMLSLSTLTQSKHPSSSQSSVHKKPTKQCQNPSQGTAQVGGSNRSDVTASTNSATARNFQPESTKRQPQQGRTLTLPEPRPPARRNAQNPRSKPHESAMAPAEDISYGVAAQVKLAHDYITEHEGYPSLLLRSDSTTDLHINIPESWLLGAVTVMRFRYEIGRESDASLSDVEEAIVRRYRAPFGLRPALDMVTVDLDKETAFVVFIREKIRKKAEEYGMGNNVNLLWVQLEINTRELYKQCGVPGRAGA